MSDSMINSYNKVPTKNLSLLLKIKSNKHLFSAGTAAPEFHRKACRGPPSPAICQLFTKEKQTS